MGCRASTQLFYYYWFSTDVCSCWEQNHQQRECHQTGVCVCWVSLRPMGQRFSQLVLGTGAKQSHSASECKFFLGGGPQRNCSCQPPHITDGNWSPERWTYFKGHIMITKMGQETRTPVRYGGKDMGRSGFFYLVCHSWLAVWFR